MSNAVWFITVTEQPARRLIGLCARIHISDSQKECPALWGKFMQGMEGLASVAEEGSFGASVNMDEKSEYDYWATMAVPQDAIVPSGMSCLEVKGGKYAECTVNSIADIGVVYQYIYSEWGKAQSLYQVDFTSAWLEYYRKGWQDGDSVSIYVPLNEVSI